MARYNTRKTVTKVSSPLNASFDSSVTTHEGGAAYASDAKSELYRLGVNLFAGGESTFYESGNDRDSRFTGLVSQLAVSDPEWTLGFLTWLRSEGNIRTASVLGAMHAIHARLESNASGVNRRFAGLVPQRLDEVPESFAIWCKEFGRPFPKALKRGAGDATRRLLNEYSWMKYDTSSHDWRIGDVIELSHVSPGPLKSDLFGLAIATRHGHPFEVNSETLPMVDANKKLRKDAQSDPKVLLDPVRLKAAGMTWEDVLSLAGNRVPKNELWNALILGGSMGYMALLRNLRNFEQAGISKKAEAKVISVLTDPAIVAKSKQFPFRFLSAYKNANGSQWHHPLETALGYSVQNIPEFSGTTDIHIDTSASMEATLSDKSSVSRVEAAALFAIALANRNPGRVNTYMFASYVRPWNVPKGGSVLRNTEDLLNRVGEVGHGTETVNAVKSTYNGADRVFIFTDCQSFGGRFSSGGYSYGYSNSRNRLEDVVPESAWLYSFDLAGYKYADIPSGTGRRHQLAGLTDSAFKLPYLLERGSNAKWPWEN